MKQEEGKSIDLSSLGAFDFTPDWAKRDAGVTVGRMGRGGEGSRAPSREKSSSFDARKAPSPEKRRRPPRETERPRPLDAEIKVLPETRALGTIIRKLQSDCHAYKLKDLAYFFLENPESVLLRIAPRAQPGQTAQTFFQCKACGFASTREEDVLEHALSVHLADYYDAKEVACEPPKGTFNCVAKCGLSGVLLGPPNIHEFNSIVREMVRTRYPDMTEEQYRSHIEMVRDAETIEAWRAGATKKTVFVAKGSGDGAELSREKAESEFRQTILPSLVDRPKHLVIRADLAMKSPVKPIVWAARDALEAERRTPYGMCFALRGAFHHRKLHFFRANDARGPEFVTSAELKVFDAEHAIPELASVAKFIAENPCCDTTELPPGEETLRSLQWLVSTGHVVAYAKMGVYSAVEKFPKYGPQWKKRSQKKSAQKEKPLEQKEKPLEQKETPSEQKEKPLEQAEQPLEQMEKQQNEASSQLAE